MSRRLEQDFPTVSRRIAANTASIKAIESAQERGFLHPFTARFLLDRAKDANNWLNDQPMRIFNQNHYVNYLARGDNHRDSRRGL